MHREKVISKIRSLYQYVNSITDIEQIERDIERSKTKKEILEVLEGVEWFVSTYGKLRPQALTDSVSKLLIRSLSVQV